MECALVSWFLIRPGIRPRDKFFNPFAFLNRRYIAIPS
jgi:hypothetical protein